MQIQLCRPPWLPTLANIALGAVLGYVLQRSVFKKVPEVAPKVKQTAQEIRQRVVSPSRIQQPGGAACRLMSRTVNDLCIMITVPLLHCTCADNT